MKKYLLLTVLALFGAQYTMDAALGDWFKSKQSTPNVATGSKAPQAKTGKGHRKLTQQERIAHAQKFLAIRQRALERAQKDPKATADDIKQAESDLKRREHILANVKAGKYRHHRRHHRRSHHKGTQMKKQTGKTARA